VQQVGIHIGLHRQPPGRPPAERVGHPSDQIQPRPVGERDDLHVGHSDARRVESDPIAWSGKRLVSLPVEHLLLGEGDQAVSWLKQLIPRRCIWPLQQGRALRSLKFGRNPPWQLWLVIIPP
jgi:hypothetical protein